MTTPFVSLRAVAAMLRTGCILGMSCLATLAFATEPATPATPANARTPVALPKRAAPPVIIIKLDDVKQVNGRVPAPWARVADYFASRHLKANFGVICQTLGQATPEYVQWLRRHHDSGAIEFWFHGWDHQTRKTGDGVVTSEFKDRSFEEQGKRFADSQKLAREKLGFAFHTFGPGGGGSTGHQDAATARAMEADPDMKVWLYPSPIDAIGRETVAKGKVTVLDRVWEVNLEAAVGQPNFQRFVAGYARHPDREYFVLQGHPAAWSNERFAEFEKIIDFLVEQKAVFMTASEYAATLGGKPAQQVAAARIAAPR